MSIDTVKAFYSKVAQDQSLKNAVAALTPKDVDGLIAVAATAGFTFTAQDYLAAAKASLNPTGELSEADLMNVAGGRGPTNPKTPVASGGGVTDDPLWCC